MHLQSLPLHRLFLFLSALYLSSLCTLAQNTTESPLSTTQLASTDFFTSSSPFLSTSTTEVTDDTPSSSISFTSTSSIFTSYSSMFTSSDSPSLETTLASSFETTLQADELQISISLSLLVSDDLLADFEAYIENFVRSFIEDYSGVTIQSISVTLSTNADTSVTYDIKVIVLPSDSSATSETALVDLQSDIDDSTFDSDLTEDLESIEGISVTSSSSTALLVTPDSNQPTSEPDSEDEAAAEWLDPSTYGLLNWILLVAALCIIFVLCCVTCRCFQVCFCGSGKDKRKKSQYQVGGPLFSDGEDGASTPKKSKKKKKKKDVKEAAFHSDLVSAIEMNKKNKLLKKVKSDEEIAGLDSLDGDTVADAFDMDFDGKTDAKTEGHATKKAKVSNAGSEGNLLMTRGGPEDEDGEVPEPPKPPTGTVEDYDLL